MLGLAAIILCLAFFTILEGQVNIQAVSEQAAHGVGMAHVRGAIVLLHKAAADSARVHLAPREPLEVLVRDLAAGVSRDVADAAHAFGYGATLQLSAVGEAAHHASGGDTWSFDGARRFTLPADGADDGILWDTPCPVAPLPSCATGAFLVLSATISIEDGVLELTEPLLVAGPTS